MGKRKEKFLRHFEELIEQLGPVKFRRLADEAYDAHGKGDGESGTMASQSLCDGEPGRWRGHARIHPEVTQVELRRGTDTSSSSKASIG